MEIEFSKPGKAGKQLDEVLETGGGFDVILGERRLHGLTNAVKILLNRTNWTKNIGITNREEEFQRFQETSDYTPEFEFRQPVYGRERMLEVLEAVTRETRRIDSEVLERYNPEKLEVRDFQQLFSGVFEELGLYVKLAANIEDVKEWRKYSGKLWPMVDGNTAEKSMQRLNELNPFNEEKELRASDVKKMWEDELERINVDYTVETRKVDGCFNIPEEATVVVAEGGDRERLYSEKEARMLTMHELFHVVRAHNGFNAGTQDFPPILGLHTPFYDAAEEGGAVYREHATGVSTESQEFDYHLRLMAAYYLHQGRDFRETVRKLVDHGGSERRSFYLAARNREVLRHHIYLSGYREWDTRKELWPLLIGKVSTDWAKRLGQEVKAGGMIGEPAVTAEQLFEKPRF